MNVITVLTLAVVGYFVFVALWLTKIEDYLDIGGDAPSEEAHGE